MIIIATNEEKNINDKPYPKLMATIEGGIVLFERDRCGFVIKTHDEWWSVGYSSSGWAMEGFTDYNEPVTIQNA